MRILAPTTLGADIMLRPEERGQDQPGYLADLILVDGDPLADVTVLQDHAAIQVIMKDGAFHKQDAPLDESSGLDAPAGQVTEKTREYVEARP